ncbi:MAG: hypothetical protein Q8865_02540 [Bacillota bacterium]|nr:hypothetical protein [Bacillota bacterium]
MLLTMLVLVLLIFLTVWGTLLLVRYTAQSMLFSLKANEERMVIAIPLAGSVVEAEYIIRTALNMTRDKNCAIEIVLVNCGVDEETAEVCAKMASDYSNIVVLDADEFADYMRAKAHCRITTD